jgi:K+-transporting ATPase ATPase A chain
MIVIAVFVGGLMVGRTPEYRGKKLEARELKLAAFGALGVPTLLLRALALGPIVEGLAR